MQIELESRSGTPLKKCSKPTFIDQTGGSCQVLPLARARTMMATSAVFGPSTPRPEWNFDDGLRPEKYCHGETETVAKPSIPVASTMEPEMVWLPGVTSVNPLGQVWEPASAGVK